MIKTSDIQGHITPLTVNSCMKITLDSWFRYWSDVPKSIAVCEITVDVVCSSKPSERYKPYGVTYINFIGSITTLTPNSFFFTEPSNLAFFLSCIETLMKSEVQNTYNNMSVIWEPRNTYNTLFNNSKKKYQQFLHVCNCFTNCHHPPPQKKLPCHAETEVIVDESLF